MSPEELRARIRATSAAFADEIVALFGQAFASVAQECKTAGDVAETSSTNTAAPVTKPASEEATAAPANKASSSSKPANPAADLSNRRSASDLKKVGDRVVKLLGVNENGLRIEQINKILGTTTGGLIRPMKRLLASGRVKKQFEGRSTVYFKG